MGEDEGKPTLQLDKGESVYSYAIFLPPVIQYKSGTLCTWEFTIGVILMVLNFSMQVGLTYVVGSGVIADGQAWRDTLVGVDPEEQMEQGQVSKDWNQEVSFLNLASHKKVSADDSNPEEFLHVLGLDHHKEGTTSLRANDLVPKDTMQFSAASARKPAGGKGGAASAANNNDGGGGGSSTLCTMSNATYSCLPPSVKFAVRWEDLDLDGNGVWSREEAMEDKHNLEKKLGAKPFLVFRAIIVGLIDRQPLDSKLFVDSRGLMAHMTGLPRPYFEYWMGDAAICSFADAGMCSTLLSRGVFDKAFEHPGKEISDIDGALDYCTFMLKEGGGCDQSLPQIYKLYRASRHEHCGNSNFYSGGIYRNPSNPTDKIYIIANWYDGISKHLKADSLIFQSFIFLVLLLWFYALVNEMREMIKLGEFANSYPAAEGDLGIEVVKGEDGVLIYLGIVGSIFLILETGYMDLLMNAIALVFVIEVDELLFGAIARVSTKTTLEAIEDLEFETNLPTEGCLGWMLLKDFWGIIAFPIISIALILIHSLFVTAPVLDALNCACYQTGPQCKDAYTYDKAFWDNYWSKVLPNAMDMIAELRTESTESVLR